MNITRQSTLTETSDRQFGWFFGALGLVLTLWFWTKGKGIQWPLCSVALFLLMAGTCCPKVLRPLNWCWYGLGRLLHRLTNPLIMGFLFFGVMTPMAWLRRVFGASQFDMGFDANKESYWQRRTPPGPDPKQLPYQY